ncbi:putative membrane protein YccC [Aeromonas sp. BIGb0405]|uniref:FUSC family protein n=1 Tax=Aeromonas sp. BIGb0405 TaxID=2940592 RepID=UPI002168BFE2|nr:FUSC family protein [Aeromonas sp. BIGb0405]MCS3456319.1 putative membrane protein YccC [Aeromonas sp. BIGb0405]
MKLALPRWHQSPWGKASAEQWRYALRNGLAMCLALWLAFVLQLDSPYWAMTSAAVVSFPTVGGVISKSLGRVLGSLMGAVAAILIASYGLADPWLFSLLIALWIGLCTYVSNHYQNNVSYGFALAGYTAAIIAFSCVNVDDPLYIFDIAQARVSEVITGILCGAFMMMLLPSTGDGETLLGSLRQSQARLLEHAQLLWQGQSNAEIRHAHQGIISQILTMNVLRIQAVWSHHRFRRHNRLFNYLLHRQLRMTSLISGVRRLLHNWPAPPAGLDALLAELLGALAAPDCDKLRIARLLAPLAGSEDYRTQVFWQRLRHFCWCYLEAQRWLDRLAQARQRGQDEPAHWPAPPRLAPLAMHTDSYEAAYNGARTFLCVLLGCIFWFQTQWDAGSSALTLLSISCVLYSAVPAPLKSVTTMLQAIVLLSLVCFGVKFGLMIRLEALWPFILLLLPTLVTMQLIKLQRPASAALWGQLIVMLGSFLAISNPPRYDYLGYINGSLAQMLGVMAAGLAFQILRPSSDGRKSSRLMRRLRRDFMDQLRTGPRLGEHEFESRIYHAISQLSLSQDQHSRLWVLRWGVVLLNCSHIVWQLREWRGLNPALYPVRDRCIRSLKGILTEGGVQQERLGHTLSELARLDALLARHPDRESRALAGLIWRLSSSLSQLQQALPSD